MRRGLGMLCPFCGQHSSVLATRLGREWTRERRCPEDHRFRTRETIVEVRLDGKWKTALKREKEGGKR